MKEEHPNQKSNHESHIGETEATITVSLNPSVPQNTRVVVQRRREIISTYIYNDCDGRSRTVTCRLK